MMIDLDNLKKEEGYRVPDGYFEQLPKQVIQNLHKRKAKRRTLWISAVAAAMTLVICGTGVLNYMDNIEDNAAKRKVAEQQKMEEKQLENQMIDYYNSELAQIDYFYY